MSAALKVLYIGPFRGQADEGMRGIAAAVTDRAADRWSVQRVDTRLALTRRAIADASAFAPDIVHYLSGPTVRSLTVLRAYRYLSPGTKTVASAVRPHFRRFRRTVLRTLAPDLMLSQSPAWEAEFNAAGIPTRFLPNGIDLSRFKPLPASRRTELRAKYELPQDARIVLHVGHLKGNRNLEALATVSRQQEWTVVIVGSASQGQDGVVVQRLRDDGCVLLDKYLPNIEEIYACADVFVFPVMPAHSLNVGYNEVGVIDMPLSLLEALASGLPAISTRMPALERVFHESASLRWFDGSAGELMKHLGQVRRDDAGRAAVADLDWPLVIDRLASIYHDLLAA